MWRYDKVEKIGARFTIVGIINEPKTYELLKAYITLYVDNFFLVKLVTSMLLWNICKS